MKLREIGYLLGLRPKPKRYGWEVDAYDLAHEGRIEFARWLHPRHTDAEPTQATVDELRTILKPGDFAIDVGAYVGDTAVPMALAVGREGCVLALEPNEYVFPVLEANARLNQRLTNIVPLMVAAGTEDGELEFSYSDPDFCNGGKLEDVSRWRHGHAFSLAVRAVRLSNLLRRDFADCLPRLKYIKTDAEGYDLSVLESIRDILAQFQPYVKSEVHKFTSSDKRRAMLQFFLDLGYRIHRFESDTCLRGEPIGLDDALRWRHYDVFCVPEGEP